MAAGRRAAGEDRARPSVDVVVPFAGSAEELAELLERLGRVRLRDGDSLTVVDNRPGTAWPKPRDGVRMVGAGSVRSSYFARNAGAEAGLGEWLLFVDADVQLPPDLLDAYFATPPGGRVGVLAGAVVDEPGGGSLTMSYARLRGSMSQGNTLLAGYAQTANCAVRRPAFEEVGGFRAGVRSGGDADLCFRLRAAGWEIEGRDTAAVVHRSRRTLRALLRQRARHGAGAAWLEREHPGSFRRERLRGVAVWTVKSWARALRALARGRRDDAVVAFVDPLSMWAFELGRRLPGANRARRGR